MLSAQPTTLSQRLLSLDFLRGLIMVLLMMESTGLYEYLNEQTEGQASKCHFPAVGSPSWNGLRFWDLIQPAFMFMAGVAMAYSLKRQWSQGISWSRALKDPEALRLVVLLGRARLCRP